MSTILPKAPSLFSQCGARKRLETLQLTHKAKPIKSVILNLLILKSLQRILTLNEGLV